MVAGIGGSGGTIASEADGTIYTIDAAFGKSPVGTTIKDIIFNKPNRVNQKTNSNTLAVTGYTNAQLSRLGYLFKDRPIF